MARFLCEFEVFGRVQGVFFRKYTKQQADLLHLTGWCMNTRDDSVKGEIEGPEAAINQMKEWLEKTGSPPGPPSLHSNQLINRFMKTSQYADKHIVSLKSKLRSKIIPDNEIRNIIKSILNIRCQYGATIADIQNDYEELIGKPLMDIYNHLNSIDCVYCNGSPNGELKWYVHSSNMQHITKFILEQKTPIQKPSQPQKVLKSSLIRNDCFFKDNNVYKNMRKYKPKKTYQSDDICNNNIKGYQNIQSAPTHQVHAQLIGDDFFRVLNTTDMMDETIIRRDGVQQNGMCVSGLSIQAAAKLIEQAPNFKSSHLVINVGTVDILHGHNVIEMCSDFDKLIKACELRDVRPIITTLAPIANCSYSTQMYEKLLSFNAFLLDKYLTVYPLIDIWSKMTKPSGRIDIDYFESNSIYVSGSNCPHVLWSLSGRKMIRNYMEHVVSKFLKLERVYIDA